MSIAVLRPLNLPQQKGSLKAFNLTAVISTQLQGKLRKGMRPAPQPMLLQAVPWKGSMGMTSSQGAWESQENPC